MSKSKKITLVLPPDERMKSCPISSKEERWYFASSNDVTLCDSVWQGNIAFPLVCIGLWSCFKRNLDDPFDVDKYDEPWHDLANGKIDLSDCKFRKLTMKERKELGL